MAEDSARTCFVISPIGGEESTTRKWANQTIKYLIGPVAEKHGLRVLRADQEDRAGIITTHIIQRLVGSELVIADLTGRNPNVFYELAVRHVTRKPLVQIIRAEEEIPFDVQGMRTVKFELNDPDVLEEARTVLDRHVGAVMEEGEIDTPISQAVGQQVAIESGDPRQVELAELSQAVQALTAEVRAQSPRYLQEFSWESDLDPIIQGKIEEVPLVNLKDDPSFVRFVETQLPKDSGKGKAGERSEVKRRSTRKKP